MKSEKMDWFKESMTLFEDSTTEYNVTSLLTVLKALVRFARSMHKFLKNQKAHKTTHRYSSFLNVFSVIQRPHDVNAFSFLAIKLMKKIK